MLRVRKVVIFVLIVSGIAYFLTANFMARAMTQGERLPQVETPEKYTLPFTDVQFSARGEDVKLSGWYVFSPQNTQTIIFVPGISSTRSHLNRVELAARLLPRGFNSLLFDLRGSGDSEGDLISGGYFEQQDVLGAFDYLKQQNVAAECIGVLGASMGGAASILAAARAPLLAALVVDSAYADIDDLIVQETAKKVPSLPPSAIRFFLPGMKVVAKIRYGIALSTLKPERAISTLSYPVLVIHSVADARIPFTQGERIYQAAPTGSSFWEIPEAKHANGFASYPEEYTQRVSAYLEERLASAGCI